MHLTTGSHGPNPGDRVPVLVTHTNSRTWVNPRMAEHERWLEVERNLKKMELIPRSPFVPHTFEQWLAFRQGRLEDERAEQYKKLSSRQSSGAYIQGSSEPVKIMPAMGGREFFDGFSTVLCMPTMWNPWSSPTEILPQALWPCAEEMKEEGDERNTSKFGRFLSLPRVPGNDTVVWKQKKHLRSLDFDEVWRLPNAETFMEMRRRTEADEMSKMEGLIGQDLSDALDCKSYDNF